MGERSLLVFADYVCPFCYLGETQVERLRSEIEVVGAAFELRPAGTPLPSMDEAWMRMAWERSVEPLARSIGVTMSYPSFNTRTRKAHEAVAYAASHDEGRRMRRAVYDAYWQDGRDIGRIDVLVELGAGLGLDRTELKVALDVDQWTARVEQEEAAAARLRLEGVPAYVLLEGGEGRDLRVGFRREDELREWVFE